MKSIYLAICLVFIASVCFADVSAKVLSYEKEIRNNNPLIKVTAEYIYPDGKKVLGVTRYNYSNFSYATVDKDVEEHRKTIIKYYIKANRDAINNRKEEIIDAFITEQDNLPAKDRITAIEGSVKDLYIPDLDITIQAEGITD